MNNTLVSDNNNFTIETASMFMGVTKSTIKNWIKCGYIDYENNIIKSETLKNLRLSIAHGATLKLNRRANKSLSNNTFIPKEYTTTADITKEITEIVSYLKNKELEIDKSISFILLNLLCSSKMICISDGKIETDNKILEKEILGWGHIDTTDPEYCRILSFALPQHHDIAGVIYQSFLYEGEKSKRGSYYTPPAVIEPIVKEFVKSGSKVLDPCCGTGQFLLSFSKVVSDPENIYGFDIDPIAVRISRINIILQYRSITFAPNIFCTNSLTKPYYSTSFDVIATNPPWGVHFTEEDKKRLNAVCPEIISGDSFSYFLSVYLKMLNNNGILSFILPESILNVKAHKHIRETILNLYSIKKIELLGPIFKKVFSQVIRIDIEKKHTPDNKVEIVTKSKNYFIPQKRFSSNNDSIFDIHLNEYDHKLMEKIAILPGTTLKGNAHWALGIVTGHNDRVIKQVCSADCEPIYTGKEVVPFYLKRASGFIKFQPETYQQVAPEWKYRAKEKLVYKFISSSPVFAYDNTGGLMLNSANIVIPTVDYSLKVILALFNSTLYNFMYKKRFSSVKILRSHIEEFHLPFFPADTILNIENMVSDIINKRPDNYQELDDYIFKCFDITDSEKEYIKKTIY